MFLNILHSVPGLVGNALILTPGIPEFQIGGPDDNDPYGAVLLYVCM